MNNIIKIIFISIVVVVIALSLYLKKSAEGAVGAANTFVELIQKGDIATAYDQLSPAMQAIATKDDLIQFVEQNQLQSATAGDWTSINKNAAREVLSTNVSTSEHPSKPLAAVFSNGQNGWRLDAMLFPQEPGADKLKAVNPTMLQMLNLVGDAVQDFAVSLKEDNMQHFHDNISKLWQDQANATQLKQAFQSFFDANIHLTVLADVEPVINDIPQQDEMGIIVVSGFFPTQPSKLSFEQRFIWEGFSWKLIGFTANIN